jgi:hypothetical protein
MVNNNEGFMLGDEVEILKNRRQGYVVGVTDPLHTIVVATRRGTVRLHADDVRLVSREFHVR